MTTFADSLKKEIARIARKELREELTSLRKTATGHRSEIASLKKQLKAIQTQLGKLSKVGRAPVKAVASPLEIAPSAAKGKPGRKVLFTAERLKAERARMGLTQLQMAQLLNTSSLSIWKWESGKATPRASKVPEIMKMISLGKRAALAQISKAQS